MAVRVPTNLKIYETFEVLKHASSESQARVLGVPRPNGTWDLWGIDCTECGGAEEAKHSSNDDHILIEQARNHGYRCRDRYRPRAKRCYDADRRGDTFNCPRCR